MTTVSFDDFADEVFDSHSLNINDVIEVANVGESDEFDAEHGIAIGSLMIYTDAFGTIVVSPDAEIRYEPTFKKYFVDALVGVDLDDQEVHIQLLQLK